MIRDIHLIEEIVRAASCGQSLGQIASCCGASKSTVKRIVDVARAHHLSWEQFSGLTDETIKCLFIPERRATMDYFEPDWEDCFLKHQRKVKPLALSVLWDGYRESVPEGKKTLSYAAFCRQYKAYVENLPEKFQVVSMTFHWNPGEAAMIDYAGDTLEYGAGSDKHQAQFFVGVLCHSGYIFTVATRSQERVCWLDAINQMLQYFGGVPESILLDNSTSLVRHCDQFNPKNCSELNAMSRYFGFDAHAVRPARPTDKGLAENAVQQVQNRIIHVLYGQQFMDLDEINEAIPPLLKKLNEKAMTEKVSSRIELFLSSEKKYLQPLPSIPYEPGLIEVIRKVRSDYRIRFNRKSFSVPHEYVGRLVLVRIWTQKGILACFDMKTGAEIARFHYGTDTPQDNVKAEHMPEQHRAVVRSREALLETIERQLGAKTKELAARITKNQPLLTARRLLGGILSMGSRITPELMETCSGSVLKRPQPTYDALVAEVDQAIGGEETQTVHLPRGVKLKKPAVKKNLRGKAYYARNSGGRHEEA